MRVDPSEQSKQDVRKIALYIAQDSQTAALRFLDAIEETYTAVGEFPDIGHTPFFDFVEGLQTILVKGFKHHQIFYRVLEDRVRIERVADGRRDLPELFKYLNTDSS